MLFVFLPPLIFGEAMSLNWYHLKGGFIQSVILAGPGVLIGAALMGVLTKVILPYDWSWNLAMVFGSILSATDPVAVVALLKSVGASPKLTILIVGESLLNDGSAMVLFTIFYNAVNGQHWTVGSVAYFAFAAAVGSILLGVAFGLVTVRWLRTANRPLNDTDVFMQIAITICCAYLTFFTAQYSLGISGVLACCGAGAMVAWLAPPIILNHESMHNVWGMIEWSLNTLIFLIAGLVIGHRVLGKVNAIDWVYLLILYALLMIIRGVTLTILYPTIAHIGHRCTEREALFMSWAGLRGALGMALALIVENNCPEDIHDETSRLFFFVGGIAAMTLVFNATTAKSLLFGLGLLSNDSAEKQLVTTQIKKKLRRQMGKVVDQMTKDFSFTDEDLSEVRQSCSLFQNMQITTPSFSAINGPSRANRQSTAIEEVETMTQLLNESALRNHRKSLNIQSDAATMLTENIIPDRSNGGDNEDDDDDDDNFIANIIQGNTNANSAGGSTSMSLSQSLNRNSRRKSQRKGSESFFTLSKLQQEFKLNESSRLRNLSRLLSVSHRGNTPMIIYELLIYIRAIFLEIVRVKYWHYIEIGKLPRLSHSAQFLLYTIEVGLDEVKHMSGARDWFCLEEELNYSPWNIQFLATYEKFMPACCGVGLATNFLGRLEARKEKREVYMLTSFIEAHEHAQKKIHAFLSMMDEENSKDGESEAIQSPEEIKVISESKEVVEKAKRRLSSMSSDTVAAIRSKQAARMVLAKEAELVKNLVQEGLLTKGHAEEFLEEITDDTAKIEEKRNRMYHQHGQLKGVKRRQQREDQEDFTTRRSSLFSWWDVPAPTESLFYNPISTSEPLISEDRPPTNDQI